MRRVAVTGAGGLVGSALVSALKADGWDVVELSRRPAPGAVVWNPSGDWDASPLEGIDAAIHLAGETVAQRWTEAAKVRIVQSRTKGTSSLCYALASLKRRPSVLVCASAVGIYGNRGDEVLTEASPPGDSFLSAVVRGWEAASTGWRTADVDAGIDVVHLRLGVVLSKKGGALAKMLTPFKLGLGGPVGDGRQYLSWVALEDVVRAFQFALAHPDLGTANVVSPNPVTSAEFARVLGASLHRPAFMPLPAFMVRLLFGQMGEEVLLSSQRVSPARLLAAGFAFHCPELRDALK